MKDPNGFLTLLDAGMSIARFNFSHGDHKVIKLFLYYLLKEPWKTFTRFKRCFKTTSKFNMCSYVRYEGTGNSNRKISRWKKSNNRKRFSFQIK